MDLDVILKRADELLATTKAGEHDATQISEGYHGALNLLRVVHGPGSVQEAQLIQAMTTADKAKGGSRRSNLQDYVSPAVQGALGSLQADVTAGLTGNIAMQASGVELGDFLTLAKQALNEGGEGEKNVAAVLVAAAFEDTLRRLAEAKAAVTDRPKLEDVIGKLKTAGVLAGASVSTANSGLNFRNDSLHAHWQHVDKVTIGTYLAFVEGLLLKHFA
jgi:hypothetical protein